MMIFNINQSIKVKIKEDGLVHIVNYYNSLLPLKLHTCYKLEKSKLDENGFKEMQMHEFLAVFGGPDLLISDYVHMDIEIPFKCPNSNP